MADAAVVDAEAQLTGRAEFVIVDPASAASLRQRDKATLISSSSTLDGMSRAKPLLAGRRDRSANGDGGDAVGGEAGRSRKLMICSGGHTPGWRGASEAKERWREADDDGRRGRGGGEPARTAGV